MKKIIVLLIMVTMVLGFSFVVAAQNTYTTEWNGVIQDWSDVGNIYEGDPNDVVGPAILGVTAKFADYAQLEVKRNHSFFMTEDDTDPSEALLLGKAGIYTNDGTIFTGIMMDAYPDDDVVHQGFSSDDDDSLLNLATILVRTNSPISVNFSWQPVSWMPDVDTILAIWERDPNPVTDTNVVAVSDFDHNQVKVANIFTESNNFGSYVAAFGDAPEALINQADFETSASMLQNYAHCNEREYEVIVGFRLEKDITGVAAGEYHAKVQVTLEEPGIAI